MKPAPNSDYVSLFLMPWHNLEKSEYGLGLGGLAEHNLFANLSYSFYGFGGFGGLGYQQVKGKEIIVDNFIDSLGYIIDPPPRRSKIVYNDNHIVPTGLHFGLDFHITKDMSIHGAYEPRYNIYDTDCSLNGSPLSATIAFITLEHTFRAGLRIRF